MIRKLTLIFYAALAITVTANQPQLNVKGGEGASCGIVVRDLKSGHDIISHNATSLFSPASTMKLVTSAAALSTVGKDFRYVTEASALGRVSDGVLYGDIIIIPSGDPTLYSQHFKNTDTFIADIANSLIDKGIHSITGDVIVEDQWMPQQGQIPTWEIDDVAYSYGAGYYALNFNDNVFTLNTATETTSPYVPLSDILIEETDSTTEVIHGVNSQLYLVKSPDVMKPSNRVVLTMDNPAEVFTWQLAEKITDAGIKFVDPVSAGDTQDTDTIMLAKTVSPPLSEILKSLMTRSDNMMAEGTLRLLAPGKSRKEAIAMETDFYERRGIDCSLTCIRDGSGLTRSNLLSPAFLADVLQSMASDSIAQTYVNLFPRAGLDGTMKTFLSGTVLQRRLVMKTGSMSHVRCYAGYLLDKNLKPEKVVVVMVNNFLGKSSDLKKAIEQYLLKNLK